jgi:GH15 family glucan-1,4-alpha-glucosidase
MNEYPAIAEHGLIGDLQTCALVATDGSIDWFCSPRFDSPSIFGSLLDSKRGGHFSARPRAGAFKTEQLYFPDTAILITRFLTEDGVGELVDFMPVASDTPSEGHRLVRVVRCVRGSIEFDIEIAPRFDYGRRSHEVSVTEGGATYTAGDTTLTLSLIRDPDDEQLARPLEPTEAGDLRFSLSLVEGQMRGVALDVGPSATPRAIPVAEAQRLFDGTVDYWQDWIGQSTYTGRWREEIQRSAITLKLLTYAPSGGLVAAPTAGLPEQVGGERNWDYRFTWVRDASFSVNTLMRLGFFD